MRHLTTDEIRQIQSLLNDIKKEYLLGDVGRYTERYQDFLLKIPQRYSGTNIWSMSFSSQKDTFLHIISKKPHENHWVNKKAIFQAVSGGADLTAVNTAGKTPMDIARENNDKEMMALLVCAQRRRQWDNFMTLCMHSANWLHEKN